MTTLVVCPSKFHVLMPKKDKEAPADVCLLFCEDARTFPRDGQGCHCGRICGEVSPYIFLWCKFRTVFGKAQQLYAQLQLCGQEPHLWPFLRNVITPVAKAWKTEQCSEIRSWPAWNELWRRDCTVFSTIAQVLRTDRLFSGVFLFSQVLPLPHLISKLPFFTPRYCLFQSP